MTDLVLWKNELSTCSRKDVYRRVVEKITDTIDEHVRIYYSNKSDTVVAQLACRLQNLFNVVTGLFLLEVREDNEIISWCSLATINITKYMLQRHRDGIDFFSKENISVLSDALDYAFPPLKHPHVWKSSEWDNDIPLGETDIEMLYSIAIFGDVGKCSSFWGFLMDRVKSLKLDSTRFLPPNSIIQHEFKWDNNTPELWNTLKQCMYESEPDVFLELYRDVSPSPLYSQYLLQTLLSDTLGVSTL